MDVLTSGEIDSLVNNSRLVRKYNEVIDRESAYEILTKKLEDAFGEAEATPEAPKKAEKGILQTVLDSSITKQVGRSLAREITRGILGVLGIGGNRSRKGLFG